MNEKIGQKLSGWITGVFMATFFLSVLTDAAEDTGIVSPARQDHIALVSPLENAIVSQLNPGQKRYLALPRSERVIIFADPDKRTQLVKETGHYPEPVAFTWEKLSGNDLVYILHVSRENDFSSGQTLVTKNGSASVTNLRINCTYYWKVTTKRPDGIIVSSPTWSFRTADEAPRLIRIDGVANVRDLGGRPALDGMRVRQDMIFRSAGLNDQAVWGYEDEDVVLDRDNGRLRAIKRKLEEKVEREKHMLSDLSGITGVPYSLSPVWFAFRLPENLSDQDRDSILQQTSVPAALLGAKRQELAADSDGRCAFSKPVDGASAVFMQEFAAPKEGFMQVGCGGDWYWSLYVNGELAYDKSAGNQATPVCAQNFVINIPVRQGKNIAAVILKSGSKGWAWCCAQQPPVSNDIVLKNQIAADEHAMELLGKERKAIRPGDNRFTGEMRRYLLGPLGIRTDIDLRYDRECFGMNGSPLGDGVRWVHVPLYPYEKMQQDVSKKAFAEIFRVLCDRKNYPVIFHCNSGADRGGSLAFVLNGLLGVDEEELYKDWEVTGFWRQNPVYNHANHFDRLVAGFKTNYLRATWTKTLESYAISSGVTQTELDTFRQIMLEHAD